MKPTKALLAFALIASGSGALALASGPATPGAPATPPTASAEDTFESLQTAYDKAQDEYRAKLKEADRKERMKLRRNSPIKQFWPRFEALAKTNDGRSLLWMTENITKYRGFKKKERPAALAPMFDALFEHHADAEWFEGAYASLANHSGVLDTKMVQELFDKGLEKAGSDDVKEAGLFHAIIAFSKADDRSLSQGYFARLEEAFPESERLRAARRALIRPEDTAVGKVAPNFQAKTIDDFTFELEDYRGKVVLLDFYGFW